MTALQMSYLSSSAQSLGMANRRRGTNIYHKFLRSIGIDPVEAAKVRWLDSTRNYIDGLAALYGHEDYFVALGASFGLEHMAISMWDQLIPGVMKMKSDKGMHEMNTVYWTFHRALEQQHVAVTIPKAMVIAEKLLTGLHRGLKALLELPIRYHLEWPPANLS